MKNVAVKTMKIIYTHLKTVSVKKIILSVHHNVTDIHSPIKITTNCRCLHSHYADLLLMVREKQPSIEDHYHDRPEPTPEKEVEKPSPSDYTHQISSEQQSLQKEQRSPPVYDTHYAPEPYEYPTAENVYDEEGGKYNIPVLPKGVTPVYGFGTPIHVPELSFPNRRLRFEYIPRPQAQHPQEL
jgi:hypothetical protein